MSITRAQVYSHVTFGRALVSFGHDSMINRGCVFDNVAPVSIGASVRVGQEVMFVTSNHYIGPPENRAGLPVSSAPINVGNGCWIGSRAVVLPGVNIGEGCIIAAGAVVTRDCEPNGMYGGVPARRIRDLPT